MGARTATVHFFSVEPLEAGGPAFDPDVVLDRVAALQRDDGSAYMSLTLYDRMMCTVDGSPPARLLSAWTVDMQSETYTERKGEIQRLLLEDDEGIAEPTFAMFFPGCVVGIYRPSPKAPGHAMIAQYLDQFAECGQMFVPMMSGDAFHKLRRDPNEILGVRLQIRTRDLASVREHHKSWADALQAAAEPTGSTLVGVYLQAELKRERDGWWNRTRGELRSLASDGTLDAFKTARVELSHRETVNLLEQRLTAKVWVDLPIGRKKISVADGADALVRAYNQAQAEIRDVLGS